MQNFFESNGYRFYFERCGNATGEKIVFTHSLLLDSRIFDYQIESLKKDFEIIAIDLPGHGKSNGPANSTWTLEEMADAICAGLEKEGFSRFHWVGLSIGGMLGLRVALHESDRLKSLAVLNSSAGEEPSKSKAQYLAMAEMVKDGKLEFLLDDIFKLFFLEKTIAEKTTFMKKLREDLGRIDPIGIYKASLAVFLRNDLLMQIGRIKIKTLVLTGKYDQSMLEEYSHQMHTGIAGSILKVLPTAHISTVDEPDIVLSCLREFLPK